MYPVSDAFMDAVESNTRKYYWTGAIVTKNKKAYFFCNEDIVKGSGYITGQCCCSSEIELGTVYDGHSPVGGHSCACRRLGSTGIKRNRDTRTPCRDAGCFSLFVYFVNNILGGLQVTE